MLQVHLCSMSASRTSTILAAAAMSPISAACSPDPARPTQRRLRKPQRLRAVDPWCHIQPEMMLTSPPSPMTRHQPGNPAIRSRPVNVSRVPMASSLDSPRADRGVGTSAVTAVLPRSVPTLNVSWSKMSRRVTGSGRFCNVRARTTAMCSSPCPSSYSKSSPGAQQQHVLRRARTHCRALPFPPSGQAPITPENGSCRDRR